MLKGLIACAAGMVLLFGGLAWQTWQLGQAREAAGQMGERLETCRQATQANLHTVQELADELDRCVGEDTFREGQHAVDAARRAHQAERLEREVAALQAEIATAVQPDACTHLPVPADAVERLRESADRAHRAGHQDGAPVGAGAR